MGDTVKHTQTVFDGENGDCLRAAIATVLQVDVESVPNLSTFRQSWVEALNLWADANGYTVVITDTSYPPPNRPVVAIGPAPRGHWHAVVWHGDEMVHDPHPDRTGLTQRANYIVIEPRTLSVHLGDWVTVTEATS